MGIFDNILNALGFGESSPARQKLLYTNEGRSGHVIYKDAVSEIAFYFELGGGNCIAIISIPGTKNWEKETKRSLQERESIVAFVAEQAKKDQAPNGFHKISDQFIELFSK